MGQKENPLLAYYNQENRFAELMNGWLFSGEPYIKAEDIVEADRRTDGRNERGRVYRSRYRDIFKKLNKAYIRLYIGTELMEYVDYAMPLREFSPDVCFLLMCIKYAKDKKALLRLGELSGCTDIARDTFDTITEYCGWTELTEYGEENLRKGERIDMRTGLQELIEDSRQEGMEEGKREGRKEGEYSGLELARQIFRLAGEGEEAPEIARRLSVPEEKIRWVLR